MFAMWLKAWGPIGLLAFFAENALWLLLMVPVTFILRRLAQDAERAEEEERTIIVELRDERDGRKR